jgi:hypothetical protein
VTSLSEVVVTAVCPASDLEEKQPDLVKRSPHPKFIYRKRHATIPRLPEALDSCIKLKQYLNDTRRAPGRRSGKNLNRELFEL